MYYFKMYYQPCSYSKDWYGLLNYAPPATVLMYNDEDCFCIGYMEENIHGVQHITEASAMSQIANADDTNPDVWKGDRLIHRWDEVDCYR